MNPAIVAALAVVLIGTGLIVGIYGMIPREVRTGAPRKPAHHKRLAAATVVKLGGGAAVGVVLAVVTGWVILVALVPLAVVGIPWVLRGNQSKREIEKLDALDEWSRVLAGVLSAGLGLDQAIMASQASTPAALRPQVDALVARLRSRMTTERALRQFAAEVDDTTGDKIAMTLLLGSRRPDVPLSPILTAMAQSVAKDVAARRAVQAERVKQDSVVRYVVLITLIVFGGFLLLGGQYVAPYGSALGQPVLAVLIAAYVGVIVWLRKLNNPVPLPRLLGERAKGAA